MMNKKLIALFMAAIMLVSLIAGCANTGGGASSDDDEDTGALKTGYYAVYDEDDELVYYLKVTSSKLTYYDKNGNETRKESYKYNAKKDVYLIDGDEAFEVEKSKKKLYLTDLEEDEQYLLESIDKEDIPSGGNSSATQGSTDAPADNRPSDDTTSTDVPSDNTPTTSSGDDNGGWTLPDEPTVPDVTPGYDWDDGDYENLFSGDTVDVILASNMGYTLYGTVPVELYNVIEVNDEGTGTSMEAENDGGYIMFNCDILDTEGEDIPWDDIKEYAVGGAEDVFESFGIDDYDTVDQTATINGTEWRVFGGYGYLGDEMGIEYGILASATDDGAGIVLVSVVFAATEDDAYDELEDAASEFLDSLYLY